jgi:hypothetical protein
MQIGTPRHKRDFLHNLTKTYHENIWKEEMQILEFEQLLGKFRTQKAEVDLKLERKEFNSASEGKKLLAKLEADIESVQAALEKKQADKTFWQTRIELIQRYESA